MNNTLKERCEAIKAEMTKLQSELTETQTKLFDETKVRIFNENPELISFGFKGYIPYFNDGDECVFSSSHKYPVINSFDTDRGEWQDEEGADNLTDEQRDVLAEKVIDALSIFEDKFFQNIFGDHFRVTFTRTQTEVDEYTDHN